MSKHETTDCVTNLSRAKRKPSGPLSGLKVLDFSTLLPGPYATQLLADLGATVLRIESPTRPDLMRVSPPLLDERSYAHLTVNRNKHSIAIDLKQPDSKTIIEKLLQEYDIVIEQFRPGVMQRLGLGYDSLKVINQRLIYCSITGYGQTGPLKDRAGHDINYLALSGLASYSGRKETGPVLSATQIADLAGGSHHAVIAILAAVIERATTGKGQYLDISMTDCAFSLNTLFGANALATQRDPECGEELLNGGIFYDYYRTKDERYLSFGGLEPKFVKNFFMAIGKPHWLVKATKNPGEQDSLRVGIAGVIAKKTWQEWQTLFEDKEVCVEPVLTINEAAQHPQLRSRNMVHSIDVNGKSIQQIASPLPFESCKQAPQVGKKLGEDTDVVLISLGYSDEDISALKKNKVVS